MIQLRDISKHYRDGRDKLSVLSHVDLNIAEGEFISILGPSGSGKSTLLNILGLLDLPDEGSYILNGKDVSRKGEWSRAAIRNREIGFIFQQFMLIPRLSVRENVALPLQYSRLSGREKKMRVEYALEQVGMEHKKKEKPTRLSGGQKQKVAIARALVTDPSVLLADEPTGNLDIDSKQDVVHILQSLHAAGKTIVLVTHDHSLAAIADRTLCMENRTLLPYPHKAKLKEGESTL